MHVVGRDPSRLEIGYGVDGTEVCTDNELPDGSSEDCLLDTSWWTSGEHTLAIAASGGTNSDCSLGVTYRAC